MKTKIKRKPAKKHWYKMYVGECPVCGRDQSFRERVYGERPEDRKDRYEYLPDTFTYDNCMGY
jgi:hypothetical protein